MTARSFTDAGAARTRGDKLAQVRADLDLVGAQDGHADALEDRRRWTAYPTLYEEATSRADGLHFRRFCSNASSKKVVWAAL